MKLLWAAIAALAVGLPDPAVAHAVIEGLNSFQGGLLHPVLEPAHALSLVALGLMVGQQRAPHRTPLMFAFAGALLAAILLVVFAFAVTEAGTVLLACGGLAGLLVALARPLPIALTGALIVVAGLALELDSVPAIISTQDTLLALGGTALGAWLALMFVAGSTLAPKREWQRIGVRVLGSWAAASVILVLTLKFAK
jgi:hydrogenase/urease accessory protein HupE